MDVQQQRDPDDHLTNRNIQLFTVEVFETIMLRQTPGVFG